MQAFITMPFYSATNFQDIYTVVKVMTQQCLCCPGEHIASFIDTIFGHIDMSTVRIRR